MDDDSEYSDGEIVWVKLSYCWWPGEVVAGDRLTEEFLSTLKRRPLAVVKFFEEDSYEYVKNTNFIYKYNCNRKHEFLRKGLEQYRGKNKHMEKFPADVMHAERATGGDPNIVNSTDFLPQKRESYADIFQPDKSKGKNKPVQTPRVGKKTVSPSKVIPVIPVRKHEVRILAQASSPTGISIGSRGLSASLSPLSPPSLAALSPMLRAANASLSISASLPTPGGAVQASPSQIYHCHKCGFESGRQNVIVLHTKHCRAIPSVPLTVPAVKVPRSVGSPPEKPKEESKPITPEQVESIPPPKEEIEEVKKSVEQEELVEVIQVVEPTPARGRASRTPRETPVVATSTPKPDRRRNRGRGKAVAEAITAESVEKVEIVQEVVEDKVPEVAVVVEKEIIEPVVVSPDDKVEKDLKSKPDVELKNELLADWSEDEQDEQEVDTVKEDSAKKVESTDEVDKALVEEKTTPVASMADTSLEKSTESSPQIASPVLSGTTIKYRNIPKKQKREFIEVTNDQPVLPVSTIEKSSSESSISTAATCGESLSLPDKSSTSSESQLERPISAKQRILDRATRGSSKSISSDELKMESPTKAAASESQQVVEEAPKKEISCFDFKEEEEEEVVLSKSPRRSLSNRRDTSLEVNSSVAEIVKEQEELERAKKDAALKNEIESLLCEASVPALPEIPKVVRAPSPGPSPSSTETTPQSKEELDRNRTLPIKERGKRIFKTRNKPIENEAIALEQSKAIVMDFVKKSHEEELAELRQQQEAEAKLSSASPTTTNDDSQESLASHEPVRFENSEFAAIKVKRTKFSRAENLATVTNNKEVSQESAVSSSNETKSTETESLPVSINKDQLALDSLEKPVANTTITAAKGRKGKHRKSATVIEPVEKPMKQVEPEIASPVEEATPRSRKKRASELQGLDLTALETPRSRRARPVIIPEESMVIEAEMVKMHEEHVTPTSSDKQKKSKRAKKEEKEKEVELEPVETKAKEPVEEKEKEPAVVPLVEEPPPVELKTPKTKRSKHPQQRSADSTADLLIVPEPIVPTATEKEVHTVSEPVTQAEPATPVKQQPIKMIIKSKGKKSNSELICEPVIVSPAPKDEEIKEKLPKSPKSSKRKKTLSEERPEHVEKPSTCEAPVVPEQETVVKPPKLKRPKFKNEPPKANNDMQVEQTSESSTLTGPSATDLQIAEALIKLPEATHLKIDVTPEQEKPLAEDKPNSGSPVPLAKPAMTGSATKSLNPRKRHLQTLLTDMADQPKPAETVIIPEKKKCETIEVVSVAPATIVLDKPVEAEPVIDDDKFDIDNIPIVLGDSEMLEDSTISTTTSSSNLKPTPSSKSAVVSEEDDDDVKLISTTKPMTKKLVIVKNSNGSAKIIGAKEATRDASSPVPKKSLGVKSTTITIKPPVDQLSPKTVRSPTHSPPIRSAQLVQAGSGGQIVITSKGTVLTTQSPATSSSKSHMSQKTQVSHSSFKGTIVSSVSSVGTISSSTSKPAIASPPSAASQRSTPTPVKSPAKVCVQSQEIIHPPMKPRSTAKAAETQKVEFTPKKASSSTSPPKKVLAKKLSESGSPGGRPLFATSKGAPITPQPATSSAVSPGKKGHRVIKISPQKLKEFTRLGMVEDKGQGKVLTASGMKKFRQEQQLLQQQQQQHQKPKPTEQRKAPRADSIDEEPSTSTPTPPPPSDTPSEVVVAAAADSSVKEIPVISSEVEESTEAAPAASSTQSPAKPTSPAATPEETLATEENEADAAVKEVEPESSESKKVTVSPSAEASEATESTSTPVVEATTEAVETSSNVQESSQLIAVPAENFGGPANLFYLCSVREEGFVPVNNELLYLDSSNQLVALPEQASVEDIVNQAEVLEIPAGSEQATVVTATATGDVEGAIEAGQQNILLNTQDGQQIILDQQSLMALAAGGDTSQLLTPDGQQILLQGSAQELLAALAVSQSGLGIVAAEGTQIIVAQESLIDLQDAPLPGEIIQVNPNTTVETNAVLTKPPIMSTVEVPTKNGNGAEASANSPEQKVLEVASTNLNESLAAVIGVQSNPNVPTSLELPITVTNPVIAKTTTSKINPIFPPTTAISAIGIDAAVAAAAVIDLPTVAQTGTDSSQVDIHETSSSNDKNSDKDEEPVVENEPQKLTETNGKTTDEDDENREDDGENAENDLDEIIPNTPESQMNSHAEISSQFSDDESEAPVPIPTVDDDDEDENASNCSEIIPIQPNVVILRNVSNELINNNDNENSSDMEIDNPNPTSGNEENNPNQPSNPDVAEFDATNNSAVVER